MRTKANFTPYNDTQGDESAVVSKCSKTKKPGGGVETVRKTSTMLVHRFVPIVDHAFVSCIRQIKKRGRI